MLIELQGLNKTYDTPAGAFAALRGIDLTIEAGEFVAVVGKSGSGKSTLLNLVGGIDRPTSGSVSVGGTAIQGMSENELSLWRGRQVGLVFQFFQLLPTLTVAENVMLPMDFCRTFPPAERRKRALSLLDRVGVGDQANKLPSALSGGQQQRVAIARALIHEPRLLICDEPTAALDAATGRKVLELLKASACRPDRSVVVVTHDSRIFDFADRIAEMEDGIVKKIHPAGEYKAHYV
jgi:putative ABC transport system ATP-binding protein